MVRKLFAAHKLGIYCCIHGVISRIAVIVVLISLQILLMLCLSLMNIDIAGSETGLISLVGKLPNRVIQPIAEHSEYPVQHLAFSHDKKFQGSIAHGQMLKEVSSSFMHSLLITVSWSSGIWMIYCKALEILQGLKQLWGTMIVMRWIQILILQSLEKEQREKMQAKIMLWVHRTFLLIYRWMVDCKFSLTLTDSR